MTELMSAHFMDEQQLALALARNALGMQLPVSELCIQMGVDVQQIVTLSKNKSFIAMVKDYRAELEKDGEGIRLKSAVALEHSIPKLYSLVHNVDTPANVVVQGIKQMADMAGVNKQEVGAVAAGSGFVVNIDLSGLKGLAATTPARTAIDSTSKVSPPANTTSDED